MHRFGMVVMAVLLISGGSARTARHGAAVTQFGGPNRDFTYPTAELADTWPAEGPPQIWKRALGDGYSGIVVQDELLYTMYRPDEKREAVVALDAATGETVWEYAYEAPLRTRTCWSRGPGPARLL